MQDVAGHRQSRACQRRARADGQYLGDAALFPPARSRRRSRDPGRHQIYRRPFRRDARHRVGQRGDGHGAEKHACGSIGLCEGPDDVYLGLRGLRTLGVRLDRHYAVRPCGRALARSAAGSLAHAASGAAEPSAATRSGSAISPAPAGCSAWCSSRCRRKRSMPFSTRSNCSASAPPGAATRASPFRSTAPAPHRDQLGAGRTDGAIPYRA